MESIIGSFIFTDWEVVEEIGRGASGRVYEIRKSDHDVVMTCALKVIEIPQNPASVSSLRQDGMTDNQISQYFEEIVDQVVKEVKMMISLKGSPYVVNCEEFFLDKDPELIHWTIYIRMEKMTPLSVFQKKESITEGTVVKMAESLLKALILLEEKNIIHRDIKPDNILVSEFGDFKISDFGIARISAEGTENLSQRGTVNYMAPEVYRGQAYNSSVDIYSLGLVLYKLLNRNRLPFFPLTESYTAIIEQKAIVDRMTGKKELPPPVNASPETAKIILKMCAYSPEDRYHSASEVLEDFTRVDLLSGREYVEAINELEIPFDESGYYNSENNLTHSAFRDGLDDCALETPLSAQNENPPVVDPFQEEEQSFIQSEESVYSDLDLEKTQHNKEKDKYFLRKKVILILAGAIILLSLLIPYINSFEYEFIVDGGSGGGTFKKGSQISATAEKKKGYTFDHWESDDVVLSSDEAAKETVNLEMPRKNVALTAVFSLNSHKLIVTGGTGSGEYNFGDEIKVKAEFPEGDFAFDGWLVTKGNLSFDDKYLPELMFNMPDEEVAIEALYKENEYELRVNKGTGGGKYTAGTKVAVKAESQMNMTFSHWETEGMTLSDSEAAEEEVALEMPCNNATLTAIYTTDQYTLTITGGSGSGVYEVGTEVTIEAEYPKGDYSFAGWQVTNGRMSLENPESERQTFVMPANSVELKAVFMQNKYSLTVNNGYGAGEFAAGEQITLSADPLKNQMQFSYWTVDKGTMEFADNTAASIVFTMPEEDVTVTAHYKEAKFTAKVLNGSGNGIYSPGDTVALHADAIDSGGAAFDFWSVEEGPAAIINDSGNPDASFSMPSENVVIKAIYTDSETEESTVASEEYYLSVSGGSGTGYYAPGTTILITHSAVPGETFVQWIIVKSGFAPVTASGDQLTYTMPNTNVNITAVFSK